MKKLILTTICLLGVSGTLLSQAYNNPTIATCDGVQFYCITGPLEEICVNVPTLLCVSRGGLLMVRC
jgi:hypothetical protein